MLCLGDHASRWRSRLVQAAGAVPEHDVAPPVAPSSHAFSLPGMSCAVSVSGEPGQGGKTRSGCTWLMTHGKNPNSSSTRFPPEAFGPRPSRDQFRSGRGPRALGDASSLQVRSHPRHRRVAAEPAKRAVPRPAMLRGTRKQAGGLMRSGAFVSGVPPSWSRGTPAQRRTRGSEDLLHGMRRRNFPASLPAAFWPRSLRALRLGVHAGPRRSPVGLSFPAPQAAGSPHVTGHRG